MTAKPLPAKDPAGLDELIYAAGKGVTHFLERLAAAKLGRPVQLWDGPDGLGAILREELDNAGISNKRLPEARNASLHPAGCRRGAGKNVRLCGGPVYGLRGLGIIGGPENVILANQCDLPIASWFSGACWSRAWDGLFPPPKVVAPPGAPTGVLLTSPPASGEQAASTVQDLVDQQMRDQQALNAAGVQSSVIDQAASVAVDTGDALSAPGGVPWWLWLGAGVGIFAMVAMGGGSPRRYGR